MLRKLYTQLQDALPSLETKVSDDPGGIVGFFYSAVYIIRSILKPYKTIQSGVR